MLGNTLSLRFWKGGLWPLLIGVAAFFILVGPRVLNPTNIRWLGEMGFSDPSTYQLGWSFFRHSDWSFPLGANPEYGLELSGSLVFSDSNVLFAFLFKSLSPLLPEPFQYFGIWLLACFVLQAWFGFKLVGLISDSSVIRAMGASLFVFAPPMLLRLWAHFNLVAHFLVVASIYLALQPSRERKPIKWGALLIVAALVHAYFLAMAAAIWISDLLTRSVLGKTQRKRALMEFISIALLVFLVCWQAGYFLIGGGVSSSGYGIYRMTFTSLVNPMGWSWVLSDMPGEPDGAEGFSYPGLGIIFLLVTSLPALLSRKIDLSTPIFRHLFLVVTLLGLMLFALSNRISIGSYVFEIPLPEALLRAANVFRCSGRFVWPIFYLLLLAVLYFVIRGNQNRVAAWLLGIACLLQVADTSSGWYANRKLFMSAPATSWPSPFKDPFWTEVAGNYKNIRRLPPRDYSIDWRAFADFASKHGLGTDSVYLARIDSESLESIKRRAGEMIATGTYARDSFYIIEQDLIVPVLAQIDASKHLVSKIDGFFVLAPEWKSCAYCRQDIDDFTLEQALPKTQIGERVTFSGPKSSPYLGKGWSNPESWGVWTDGGSAEIYLPIPEGDPGQLLIEANAFITGLYPKQKVIIMVNGKQVKFAELTSANNNHLVVPLPKMDEQSLQREKVLRIQMILDDAMSPKALGMSGDDRQLAVGLISAMFIDSKSIGL